MHTPVSLTPMNIHTLTVRNRFVLPGMVTDMAVDGGYVTERLLSYYEERAKGGVGLVIVEATSIDVSGKTFLHGLDISDDRFIPGLPRPPCAPRPPGSTPWKSTGPAATCSNRPCPHSPTAAPTATADRSPSACAFPPKLSAPSAPPWAGISPSSTAIPPWRTCLPGTVSTSAPPSSCAAPSRTRASTPSTSRRACNTASS